MSEIRLEQSAILEQLGQPLERLFHEDVIYDAIEAYAEKNNLIQTQEVLPYAKTKHKEQYRDGKEKIPYIYHPLLVGYHAIALGIATDDLLSAALLHDVCEDCDVLPQDLPVNEATKTVVALLTKDASSKNGKGKDAYYHGIMQNPTSFIIKLLDRCNNASSMTSGFDKKRMIKYIKETQEYFYPMMEEGKVCYPQYERQIFLIEYHIKSVVESVKYQLLSGV